MSSIALLKQLSMYTDFTRDWSHQDAGYLWHLQATPTSCYSIDNLHDVSISTYVHDEIIKHTFSCNSI